MHTRGKKLLQIRSLPVAGVGYLRLPMVPQYILILRSPRMDHRKLSIGSSGIP
jgi:hypothetical protein